MKADDVKKLQQRKYREQLGHYLVEGEHLILELFKAAIFQPHLANAQLFITENYADWVHQHNKLKLRVTIIGHKAMSQIADTQTPPGIIAAVPFAPANGKEAAHAAHSERAVYLHEIQDPGNLGTILRTLGWFGGFRCLLSPGSVDPYNPKVVRASMGAIFHVPFEQNVPLDTVQERYPRIACLDMQGKALRENSFHNYDCYVFGNEARGVPREQLDELNATAFTITGGGAIESLNLATAVNICIYELRR